jgi:hypothetical protein
MASTSLGRSVLSGACRRPRIRWRTRSRAVVVAARARLPLSAPPLNPVCLPYRALGRCVRERPPSFLLPHRSRRALVGAASRALTRARVEAPRDDVEPTRPPSRPTA